MSAFQVYMGTFHGKKVAIKKLHNSSVSEDHLMQFVNELEVMWYVVDCAHFVQDSCSLHERVCSFQYSSLHHPNTVLFMGACLEPDHMCIIMEYCEKGTLYSVLHDKSQHVDYKKILKVHLRQCTRIEFVTNALHSCWLHRF